jgi:hypothetical protein
MQVAIATRSTCDYWERRRSLTMSDISPDRQITSKTANRENRGKCPKAPHAGNQCGAKMSCLCAAKIALNPWSPARDRHPA